MTDLCEMCGKTVEDVTQIKICKECLAVKRALDETLGGHWVFSVETVKVPKKRQVVKIKDLDVLRKTTKKRWGRRLDDEDVDMYLVCLLSRLNQSKTLEEVLETFDEDVQKSNFRMALRKLCLEVLENGAA